MRARLRKRLLASLITTSLTTVALAPTSAFAQASYATLRGTAPASAAITATNTATGTVRHTQAAADGSYALVGLQPGTYTISAAGGVTKTVTLTVASTVSLDLQKAPVTEVSGVTVTASTLPEVKTPEVGTTISLHQIETIPQISRNFLEFADTVPGMVFSVDNRGHTSLRGGAQNDSSVNVYIDGVGQKSYVMGGGVTGQFASQGNPFPQLAIGQYKVITSNYKAEYGQISSAAVVAQTKSGTNQFHGQTFFRYTNDGMRARTPGENLANKKTSSHEKEYGFSIGGPIVRNKAHFFFTYEAKRFNTPITVAPGGDATLGVPFLPTDVAAKLGPANLPFKEDLYFGKIDWEFTDRDRLEFSGQWRNEHQTDNVGGVTSAEAGIDVVNTDKRFDARWQHSADLWFNELLVTYEDSFYRPSAITLGNGAIYQYEVAPSNLPTIIQTGGASPLATQNKGQKGPAIEDNLTFNDFEWHGDHVIKMGVKYKDITLHAQDAGDINPQFYYAVTSAGAATTPYKAFFTKPVAGLSLSPVVETKAKQFGVYVQDDWDVNDKLTLNLGVRWDYETNPAYTNFVTPANVVAALNGQDPNAPAGQTYAQSLANGGVNIADYISNGHNRSNDKGEWQPRLGFSYDINGDDQHVIHGGAGRSYDRNLFNYLQLETTKSALPQFTVNFQDPNTGQCLNGATPCYAWDPKYLNGLSNLQALLQASNAGTEVDLLNNHLKAPYSDQFSLGMRNQIGQWLTDVTVTRILSYDGFVFTLGNRYPDGAFFKNNSQPWGNGVPGFGSLIIGNNGIETRTSQLLVSVQKPYTRESHWGATFAYTYTDATQNRDINEHYAFDEATIRQYPFIRSNAAARHRFVATGVVDGPWGTTVSAKLTLATPIPGNYIACYFGQHTFPTGSACTPTGVTPSGNGRFLIGGKIFGYRDVDMQVTKNVDVGHGVTLYGRFDVLNLFNWKNYSDIVYTTRSLNGTPQPSTAAYNTAGNITFVPRTLKLEVGLKF